MTIGLFVSPFLSLLLACENMTTSQNVTGNRVESVWIKVHGRNGRGRYELRAGTKTPPNSLMAVGTKLIVA